MLIFIIFIYDNDNDNRGILQLKKIIDTYKFKDYKIIINSNFKIELDFDFDLINIQDELISILFSIQYFYIQDNDFIIKLNGNCYLHTHSPFMKALSKLNKGLIDYDVISKYYFIDLIGIKCKFIKNIEKSINNNNNNMKWELLKNTIDEQKQLNLYYLGIDIGQSKNKSIFSIY